MNLLVRNTILQNIPTGKIVDIGCSIGGMFGERATNVDRCSLEQLRNESKDPNLIIPNFVHAEAENLPFDSQEYDWAILGDILEHVDDPLIVLNEAQRIAKNVILSVPNEYEWADYNEPFGNSDHRRWFTEPSFSKLLKESGLIVTEYIKLNYVGWAYFIAVGISKNAQKA
jgi:2-polyprenyl-3-methyl-5-hydroxy-6-metoxy-1,4-benzoquinol methylase